MKLAYSAQQSPVNDSKQCNNSFLHCRNAAQSTQFSLEGELIQRKKTTVHNQHMNSLMFPLSERKAKSLCGIQSTTNIRKALKHHILEENGRKNSLNLITQKAKSMHRKISEFTFANNEPLIAAGKAIGLVHLVISTSSVSFEQTVTSTKKESEEAFIPLLFKLIARSAALAPASSLSYRFHVNWPQQQR
ncbi:hypothetical protein niasHS_003778 [Heterodera schachtii]|uniref:Uncharacterized protein n=1 Tax=Heterodera schachtii TaxID=97005 RepID=A0ABD2K6S6_HETSC